MIQRIALLALLIVAGCGPKAPVAAEAATESISYQAGDKKVRGTLCRPGGSGPFPALVMIHEDNGLTGWVKEQAKRLAGNGYIVLAVDLYRGEVVSGLKEDARLENAHVMERGLSEDRVLSNLKAAVDYLAGRPDVRSEHIGTIGWDTGGGYALDAANHDSRIRAVVVCYGRVATDPATLTPLRASVLGIFAGKDEGIPPETIDQFHSAMRKAGKQVGGIHVFANCPHGFMNPENVYGTSPPEAITEAWSKIDAYLAAELK